MQRLIRGVILDIDGTLIDSNEAHALAWQRAMEESGFSVPLEILRCQIGMGSDKLIPAATGLEKDTEAGRQMSSRHGEIFKAEFMPHLKAFPCVLDFIQRMREVGLKLGIATSAKEDEVRGLLRQISSEEWINELIPVKSSSADAKKTKPDPDIIEATLERLGTYPGETLMVGDTPYDIEAALKLGIQTIAFRCGGWEDEGLVGAIAIYDNPQHLLENFEASPLGLALMSGRPARRSA